MQTRLALRPTTVWVCLLVMLCLTPLSGYGATDPSIPDTLEPWKEWVLFGKEYYACPRPYNNPDDYICAWPELLDLDVNDQEGTFKQKISVFSDTYVPIPGDSLVFPLSVTLDGKQAPVLSRDKKPYVFLTRGSHSLTGRYTWAALPSFFTIPENTALVSLRVNGTVQASPSMDGENRLWISPRDIQGEKEEKREANSLQVSVFRLVEDGHPMTLLTRMELSVSGDKRREKLTLSLPDKAPVISLSSPLPMKLMEDGTLWVDVKAGTYRLDILSVINEPVSALGPLKALYGEELWSFKPVPYNRVAHMDGVQAIDPMQSRLPDDWKHFSAYRITEGSQITFVTTQRGCTGQDNDAVTLIRDLWLDFNGKGATVRDTLSGSLGERRYIFLDSQDYELGRVILHGKDQLITRSGNFSQGLELERGSLDLTAVSRMKHISSGQALSMGWNCGYESAAMNVHLPPGWRLLFVGGGKAEKTTTWLNRWSALDILLVLIVTYAAIRLWNIPWAVLFLCGFVSICHETHSPFYVGAAYVLFAALVRFKIEPALPQSKTTSFISKTLLILFVVSALLFSVSQIKTAVYPQLESMEKPDTFYDLFKNKSPVMLSAPEPMPMSESMDKTFRDEEQPMVRELRPPMPRKTEPKKKVFAVSSGNTITQTGPALPQWSWQDIGISLGRAPASQILRLWLLSPGQNALVSFIRVFLLIIIIFRIIPFRLPDRTRHRNKHENLAILIGFISLSGALCFHASPSYGDIPSAELLSELEKRLTQADECYPDCASLTEVTLTLPEEESDNGKRFLRIDTTVNAAIETAIPLPTGMETWAVYDMTLDKAPHMPVIRKPTGFWTLIPQGVHTLSIRGTAMAQNRLQFSFPMKPALIHVTGPGWDISGLDRNMQTENTVIATRNTDVPIPATNGDDMGYSEGAIKNIVRVERSLALDKEWTVVTSVERFPGTNNSQSVVVHLPLLKDEQIKSDILNLSVNGNVAQVSLIPGSQRLSWVSTLPISPSLDLAVPLDAMWAETWMLTLSPMWHLSAQGPTRICMDDSAASVWFPWPGEQAHLTFTRLEPAGGSFFTIDSASVDYHIEQGSNRIVLQSHMRTSKGQTLSIPTPDGCIVKHVRINNRTLPFSGRPQTVELPLSPGRQSIYIEWDQAEPWEASLIDRYLKPMIHAFPSIDLGHEAANIDISMHLPQRSWIVYTHGPSLGPALLTWGMCIVVLIVSPFLARLPFSPLKTRTWAILGIGLASLSLPQLVLVAGWFFIMELRKDKSVISPWLFNMIQLALMIWTACVIVILFSAVSKGLLHVPDMHITGNGSNADLLVWTQDRVSGVLPKPFIAAYSAQTYHFLMLLWALWLATHLIPWSRMALSALRTDGLFRPFRFGAGKRRIK